MTDRKFRTVFLLSLAVLGHVEGFALVIFGTQATPEHLPMTFEAVSQCPGALGMIAGAICIVIGQVALLTAE